MDPDPVPLPAGAVTEIETTEGVTRDAIALVFMALPPISTRVRFEEQVPLGETKRACVFLSAHAVTTLDGWVFATDAIDPAITAPATNALTTIAPLNFLLLINPILSYFPEIFLL
jgi:hypothetical protein